MRNEVSTDSFLQGEYRPDLILQETLPDLLEATVERMPAQTALTFGPHTLNYFEFNVRVDLAASHLIATGVISGQIIGLWLPRGIALLIMQAAISKAGAAWMAFDADTPVERILICLADAQAACMVSCEVFLPRLADCTCPVWTAECLQEPTQTCLLRRVDLLPSHPAYVIYTSGSTGKPKGIVINHGSICHFLRSENALLGVTASDRVYQGFSLAFDMSFEEIWISYLVGASVWIAPGEIASDPEVIPLALAENAITVLHAVPTLLALFNQEVSTLRLINLGGEVCPQPLVKRWSRAGRRIFNTYGPTETTVSASLAELHPDTPVTIGRPLPNYGMLVISSAVEGGLQLMPIGEVGELCITGPGLSDGYLGRPDLTVDKFLVNPWDLGANATRLYRTGDLARILPDGSVECLGRTDDQVKLRGFRVELGEIEAVLSQQAGVGAAAVVLRSENGIDQLLAFVVPQTAHQPPAVAWLRSALAAALPNYMVPGVFELLTEMPRLSSGKIDRKALKIRPLTRYVGDVSQSDLPSTEAEIALFSALSMLFPGQPIRRNADFFSDLGGHSLLAARLASAMRADARFAHVTVRDIYQNRLIGRIAEVLALARDVLPPVNTQWTAPSAFKRWRCGSAQAAAIPLLVMLHMAQWLAPFFTYHFYTGDADQSITLAVLASTASFLIATLLSFALAIAAKWLVAGRLKAGRYPLWGLTYYRWWFADRMIEAAPTYMLNGSSLYNWWLRALGAKIGRDVIIGSGTLRVADLLEIGDGASIGNAVNFENARVEHGVLHLGRIQIGRDAGVSSYAVLEGNTVIASLGHLEGQSALSDGMQVGEGRVFSGSPALDIGAFDPSSNQARPAVTKLRHALEAVFFLCGALLITTLFFLPVFPSFILIDLIDGSDDFAPITEGAVAEQLVKYFVLAFPATALLIVCTVLLSAGVRWLVLPRMKPGSWPVHSNLYCAKWLVNQIQESSLSVLHGVYATVYAPFWYRLLGAKVGRGAEISTALGLVPDMLTLGDESFIADAVMLGDEKIDAGWMTLRPTVISRRSFVGNGAYIPDGSILPENVLIGVHSCAPANADMRDGDTWLGSPPINLPARETVLGFEEHLTFNPSVLRRIGRGTVEAFRIITPHAFVIAVGFTVVLGVMPLASDGLWTEVIYYLSIAGLAYGIGTFLFVAMLKWLLVFRYKKCSVPMWTPFVWFSEAVTNLYEGIAVPNFMRYLRGTPWLPLALRLLGAKIGRGVYLDTTDITEFDCVSIGDYSELNALACPQTHLFEDRIMKVDVVTIGRRVYMGPRSCVLYSAVIGDNAKLGALTLVMKGEVIPPASAWRGCPAAPAQF
jgi:non-ribosomal peptide synthetase-like protein